TATTMTLTGSARILLGNANVTVTTLNGSGSGSYFVTNGSGALSRKSVSTGAATVFPVGASITSYTPVSLTPSTLQDWSVRVQAGFSGYPTVNVSSALPRVWHVTPAAGSSTTATDVQLGYDEADLGWNFTSLEIYHYGPPNGWALAQGNTAPGGTSNARTVMVNGQTSFSPFAITKVGSPLPVNFLSFSGKHLTGRNLLSWATAQESDNQGFSVERSTDGRSFAAIGFVQSLDPSGNSSQVLRYGFSDGAIESRAPYFYRLRQQDRTGHSRYSTVIRIDPAGAVSLQIQGLFPNPAVSDIRVAIQSPADLSGRYSIVNAAGVLVKEGPASLGAGANTLPLQVSDLPAGQYFFRLTAAGSTETWSSRFIKN
ncbi:MAG: T9SS type A sorting domain-containing protein, partial [Chitinophagaceae bacterium]